ncbi:MAG: hypothetical protein IT289_02800 [Oligoflexia bacterium]|nr:hypothetical protein [Oligoflexia bacterium]
MKRQLVSGFIVLFISFGGAGVCGYLLYRDIYFNKSTTDGLEIAGKLTEKAQVVKRKLGENMVWDLIDANETLYWNDSVQTSEQAKASIELSNGNKISIGEQSLIVLEKDNDSLSLKLKSGQLVVADGASSGILINGIDLAKAGSGSVSLQVDELQGRVLATASGDDTKQLVIDKDGNVIEQELKIALVLPEPLGQVFTESAKAEIKLVWKNRTKKPVEVFISKDREFKKIVFQQKTSALTLDITTQPGLYYWLVRSTDTKDPFVSQARSFQIVKVVEPQVSAATAVKKIMFRKEIPTTEFTWSPINGVNKYTFQFSQSEKFDDIYYQEDTSTNSIKTSKMQSGESFWRVLAHYGERKVASKVIALSVEKLQEAMPPDLLFPDAGFKVTFDFFEQTRGVAFRWSAKNTDPHRFVFSRDEKLRDELIGFETSASETVIKETYPPGTYYWTVGYKNLDGDWKYKDVRKIELGPLVPLLEPPGILMPQAGADLDLLKSPKVRWEWKEVQGARGYKFKLIRLDGEKEKVLLDDVVKGLTKEETDLPDGQYRWQVSSLDEFGRESKPIIRDFSISHGQTLEAPDFEMSEVQ